MEYIASYLIQTSLDLNESTSLIRGLYGQHYIVCRFHNRKWMNAPVIISVWKWRGVNKRCLFIDWGYMSLEVKGWWGSSLLLPPCLLEAEANWEATERKLKLRAEQKSSSLCKYICVAHIQCTPNSITMGWNRDKCHGLMSCVTAI